MGIAGLWSEAEDGALSFTMLTTEPGPDIAPYHNRQIALLPPQQWDDWLRYKVPGRDLLRPLPAGALEVRAASR
jgi:putative SOS response-associated peptidase YedK